MKKKLVLVWVDNTGFELTGRYRDALRHYPETRAKPEAKACCFGDDTPELLERLTRHVEQARRDHQWVGYFSLDNTNDLLQVARDRALAEAKS